MPPPDDGIAGRRGGGQSFHEVLTEAVRDISAHGYDSAERVAMWAARIRQAAVASMISEVDLRRALAGSLKAIYGRLVDRAGILQQHPGVSRFTLQRVAPKLRNELDRRVMASAGLIKLNREAAIQKTMQRFSGWATSVPSGGSKVVDKVETKTDIGKSLAQLPYAERRVLIDQGHKFTAELNNILAVENGAIALVWHSHWRQAGYHYRPDHKERDAQVYAIRGCWALDKGLMKAGAAGYYDQITKVGQEPLCRCFAQYIYALRALPDEMLTRKGRDELERVRRAIAA